LNLGIPKSFFLDTRRFGVSKFIIKWFLTLSTDPENSLGWQASSGNLKTKDFHLQASLCCQNNHMFCAFAFTIPKGNEQIDIKFADCDVRQWK
jgi:hypothetical protein